MSFPRLVQFGDWAHDASWWIAVGLFLVLAARESYRPERPLGNPMITRWAVHFALYAAGLALLAVAAPGELAIRLFGGGDGRLLFAQLGRAGGWLVLVGGILFLDLLMYMVHRMEHQAFPLWRFHAVHHADTDVDVTTALRHHPGEFILNSYIIIFVLLLVGGPVWLIPIYGVIFISGALFQHVNSPFDPRIERLVEFVVVTPGMHRIHHSSLPQHYEANFGAVFSLWDRLFGTYRQLDPAQRNALEFGIPGFMDAQYARAYWAWVLPFVLRRQRAGENRNAGIIR